MEQQQLDFDQKVFLLVAQFNMQYDQLIIAAKSDTVGQKRYDITKARDQLGYSPKHNLEQTIEKTINQWSQFV